MAGWDNHRVYRGRSETDRRQYGDEEIWRYRANAYNRNEVIRPLDVPIVHPLAEDSPPPDDEHCEQMYIVAGCTLATLITKNLLVHPFVVLRRQCQVNPGATKYHIIPITLVPVIIKLHQTQGLSILWKGVGSLLLVRGMTLAIEDLLSKLTPWPKKIPSNCTPRSFWQHLMLKCVAAGLMAPFYSASLVETVQSDIVSEGTGILDVFRDGALRLVEVSNKGRLIPMYYLLPPTIAYEISKYLLVFIVKGISNRIMMIKHKHAQGKGGAYTRDVVPEAVAQDIELKSIVISVCIADVILYPMETVINRLHLQGTRTIIDNLDNGRSVTPLLTGYSGVLDCYRTIISTEGPLGLYKGFGGLVLQYAVHFMVLRTTKWLLTELGNILRPVPKRNSRISK